MTRGCFVAQRSFDPLVSSCSAELQTDAGLLRGAKAQAGCCTMNGACSVLLRRRRREMQRVILAALLAVLACTHLGAQNLERSFQSPPDMARPWVFWFWMNGNITRDGITEDLESMKQVGIGGVLWMEVSGPWWAPQGPIAAGSKEWHEAMQWAISEADRLGISFALSVDFGYGSGGPHITPDLSMQKLIWSESSVSGGGTVTLQLKKPTVDFGPGLKKVWLRPGQTMNPTVMKALREVDSYRDVAVFAIRSRQEKASLIPDLEMYDGRGWKTHLPSLKRGHVVTICRSTPRTNISLRRAILVRALWASVC